MSKLITIPIDFITIEDLIIQGTSNNQLSRTLF